MNDPKSAKHQTQPDGRAERLRSYHQSLRAAVIAGVKLDLGTIRHPGTPSPQRNGAAPDAAQLGGIANLAKLARLEPMLAEAIRKSDDNQQAANSQRDDPANGLPTAYVSAFHFFEQTDRIDLVLDSLSLPSAVNQDLASTIRPVCFYMALLLLAGTGGLTVFATISGPRVTAIRNDMALQPVAEVTDSWLASPNVSPFLIVLPILTVGMILLGITTKGSAAIVGLLGGKRYRIDRSRFVLANIEKARGRFSQPEPDGRNSRLSLVATHASTLAQHRLSRLRIGLPTILIAILGGGGVLIYCLILFGPLIWLIHDMATLPIEQGMLP